MQSDENNNNNLKGLREDKGLSLESVASSLKLTTDVIKKLEESDFDNLGAYTYVRGYLNHYARLLDVDAQKYIDLIPKSKQEVPLINTRSLNTKTIKLKKHSKNFFNYAIGTFIVIAVSFSGYFLLKNYTSINDKNNEIVQSSNLDILPIEQTPTVANQNLDNKDTVNQNSNKQSPNSATDENFHFSSIIPSDNSTKKDLDSEEIALPEQNDNSETLVTENDLTNIENETTVPTYTIVINAAETSWVKVESNDGIKLHNDLLQPGTISLSSDTPVHFRIGNEKNVKVTINGEEIDLSNYSSKDIADFNWPIEG